MALPTDLTPLDSVYRGGPFCFTLSKSEIDPLSMDLVYRGGPFVTNPAVVPPPDASLGTLDEVYMGLPFAYLNADRTMDLVYMGLPFTGGSEDRNRTLVVQACALTVTAGPIGIDGWHRKHPNPRAEMVYSEQEPAHTFPYIGVQAL